MGVMRHTWHPHEANHERDPTLQTMVASLVRQGSAQTYRLSWRRRRAIASWLPFRITHAHGTLQQADGLPIIAIFLQWSILRAANEQNRFLLKACFVKT